MRILITGGAGYVGYSLIHALIRELPDLKEIRVYDNLSRGHYGLFFQSFIPDLLVNFRQGELLDSRSLQKALEGMDVVFHLAAKVTTPYSDMDSHYFEQVNHWGTAELVNMIEKSAVQCFIYLSSTAVYGRSEAPMDETAPLQPFSFYGSSKMRGEQHTERLLGQLPKAYLVRSGNVYGYNPTVRIEAVINRFMFEAHHQGRIAVQGNGEQVRAFVHVEKLATVLARLLKTEVPNGVYNLAEYNFSVNEVVTHIKTLYPELETLLSNQHLALPSAPVVLPVGLQQWLPFPEKSFADELWAMQEAFSF
ncbi:MAG: SDR family oxidoreductase [Microscillaceae bacterium]